MSAKNRTVIITGSSSGIGLDIARAFLQEGANVVINGRDATASKVRVLLQSTDGDAIWTTVGVSPNIIDASFEALLDAINYKLLKDNAAAV